MNFGRALCTALAFFGASLGAQAQSNLSVEGVPAGSPFTVRASATERTLLVDLTFGPEWHAYSRNVGGGQPVRVTLAAGGDFDATGALVAPGDAHGQLSGEVRLTLPITPTGAGRELNATFDLQVCDALECLAPLSLEISGEVETLSALLVVSEVGDRSERIAAWLVERGFAVTVDTYDEVTLAACDARDVVVADSDVFQKHGVSRAVVHAFPRTSSPLVAVGFLGTELVEAHGVAMTSGYI